VHKPTYALVPSAWVFLRKIREKSKIQKDKLTLSALTKKTKEKAKAVWQMKSKIKNSFLSKMIKLSKLIKIQKQLLQLRYEATSAELNLFNS